MKLRLFILLLLLSTVISGQTNQTYGMRRLGLYFTSQLKLATPFVLPQSYPRQEYWHESGGLWIFNATIPRRHQIKADKQKDLLTTFFFPDQIQTLKPTTAPPGVSNTGANKTLAGNISIYKNSFGVKVFEVWQKKYVHVIAVFFRPDFKTKADELWQNIRLNKNFKW